MKKVMTLIFITIFGVVTTVGCVHAGSRGRYNHHHGNGIVEGLIIGTGAALLGAAIINGLNSQPKYYNPSVVVSPERRDNYSNSDQYSNDSDEYYRDEEHKGYWSVERVWVPPLYRQQWYPGHYSRRGYWVTGGYARILVRDGYWENRRVWVRN
ncbi:MAG: hypothetical protein HQK70_14380 [Desulfamplus sp.]|nr:hypothetical protein [Desulfamplus sp.]